MKNCKTLTLFNQMKNADNVEFSMINPNLLNIDLEGSDSVSNAPVLSTIIDKLSLPKLSEGQKNLFNFIMQYALHCKLAEKNNEFNKPPKPFETFLNGGAGNGKSFLIKAIAEYLKQILRYPNQNIDQPSVLVTASTGKPATGINGFTLYSAFHFPVK